MILDILSKLSKKDPLFKRNIIKTISWRIVGSIDTMMLGWFMTGRFSTGAKIGIAELFTKMLIYYFHERFWQRTNFGLLSRTEQAQAVKKEIKPHLFQQNSKINRHDRERLFQIKPFTLWLTGLSASGKSTLAAEIEEWIFSKKEHVYILDGDNTRLGINSDLSFSDEDRAENIRRVAEICKLLNDSGVIVIASFISPFAKDRLIAKAIIGAESFFEIYIEASVEVCSSRDKKGLYKLAKQGKIKNFTGVNSAYEAPVDPFLKLNTEQLSINECLNKIKVSLATYVNFS